MSANNNEALVAVLADQTINCHNGVLGSIKQPWLLGPFDHLLVSHVVTVESVFVYQSNNEPPPDSTNLPVICPVRLKHSLERLLDFYPQLTGRFAINPNDRTPEIHHLGSGVLLRAAECARSLQSFKPLSDSRSNNENDSRITILDLPGEGSSLWCPFDITSDAISTNPILTVQHTTFACGSVSLGVRIHHWACDSTLR